MAAIFFRVGEVSEWRDVQAMLRETHDDHRAEVLADIATRTEAGDVPLDDGEGLPPLVDPGPFRPDRRLDGVRIKIRNLSSDEIAFLTTTARARYLVQQSTAAPTDVDELVAFSLNLERKARADMRAFVIKAVAEVEGGFGDGPPVDVERDIEHLEANGILVGLFTAARAYQSLTAAEKKTYGSSPPPTSASSIATPAPDHNGRSSGATAGPSPRGTLTRNGGPVILARGASPDVSQATTPRSYGSPATETAAT